MSEAEIRQEFELLDRSRDDPRIFGALYEKYFDRIFHFIYRQTDDVDLTADLCSETFLQALKHADKFEYRGVPVSAWFYKIASNEVNKHFRKAKRSRVFSIEETRIRELIAQENDVDDERIQLLVEFMMELPTNLIEILELRFFENKEFREIAFILDMTESGVKMRTYRALDKLRKRFNLKVKYDEKESN